jgi:hypothetical protein
MTVMTDAPAAVPSATIISRCIFRDNIIDADSGRNCEWVHSFVLRHFSFERSFLRFANSGAHFRFNGITYHKLDRKFSQFPRNLSQHQLLISQFDPEHRSREPGNDCADNFSIFFQYMIMNITRKNGLAILQQNQTICPFIS